MEIIKDLLKEIHDLKSDDFINIPNEEDNVPASEYERGFNAAVGICLATLEEFGFVMGNQQIIETRVLNKNL